MEFVAEQGVGQPIVSDDGEAAQVVVQVAATDGEDITASVTDMRGCSTTRPTG